MPYPVESALSGIQRTEERMWYRRTFDVPSKWRGKDRLVLNFGAVDYDTRVWVNGKQVDHAPRRLRLVLRGHHRPR